MRVIAISKTQLRAMGLRVCGETNDGVFSRRADKREEYTWPIWVESIRLDRENPANSGHMDFPRIGYIYPGEEEKENA
jgi:hypothetical protein